MKHNLRYELSDEHDDKYRDLINRAEEELELETQRNQRMKIKKYTAELEPPRVDRKRNKNYKKH